MAYESSGPSTALVSTDRIERAVSLRDAAMEHIVRAAQTIAEGYKIAQAADALSFQAADGFRDLTEGERAKRQARDAYDADDMVKSFRESLDKAVWRGLIKALRIGDLMDKTAREELDCSLQDDPPEVTADNIRATLERFRGDAGLIFQRGLARAFADLDARFKSHDAFKFGARVILDRFFNENGYVYSSSRQHQTLVDVERVLAVLDGEAPEGMRLVNRIESERPGYGSRQSEHESQYLKIRCYKNGNAHLWFTRPDLVEKANKVLAAYYGEVIPDAAEKDEDGGAFKARSTLPAKDLQFYATPEAVALHVCRDLRLMDEPRILEPSAGAGDLVRPILGRARIDAIEIHPDRLARLAELERAYSRNFRAIAANFLNQTPTPVYDYVLMNPPFYGTHWIDHVRHAWEFLKPGGELRSVLPASAMVTETEKHLAFRRWAEKENDSRWTRRLFWSLPPESFAASGTRIQTVILTMVKKA